MIFVLLPTCTAESTNLLKLFAKLFFLMLKALNFQNFAMLMLSSDQSTSYSVKKIGVTMECHRKTGLEFYAQC